ncbi:MAG: hypothetical protein OQJ83_05125, partial [Altibacter sp.]|nr:hypothetical protein [Altibacter sp.]
MFERSDRKYETQQTQFVVGFMVAGTLLSAIPEELQAIAGALMATIAAIVAATVAWMAFHGTMT